MCVINLTKFALLLNLLDPKLGHDIARFVSSFFLTGLYRLFEDFDAAHCVNDFSIILPLLIILTL